LGASGWDVSFKYLNPDMLFGAQLGLSQLTWKAGNTTVPVPESHATGGYVDVPATDLSVTPFYVGLLFGIQPIHLDLDLGFASISEKDLDSPVSSSIPSKKYSYSSIPVHPMAFLFGIGIGSQVNLSRYLALTADYRFWFIPGVYDLTTSDSHGVTGNNGEGAFPSMGSLGVAFRF
jgi:hypothetical protein